MIPNICQCFHPTSVKMGRNSSVFGDARNFLYGFGASMINVHGNSLPQSTATSATTSHTLSTPTPAPGPAAIVIRDPVLPTPYANDQNHNSNSNGNIATAENSSSGGPLTNPNTNRSFSPAFKAATIIGSNINPPLATSLAPPSATTTASGSDR
jgi:hypothetical protein